MRVALLVVGTQGDALPVAAIGRGLRDRGHRVVVATSHDHRALMEAQGLIWSELSPSYADEIGRAGTDLDGRAGVALLRARMIEASAAWAGQVRAAAFDAQLVIGMGLAMGAVASACGEAFGAASVQAGVMPLTPTRAYPPPIPPPPPIRMPGWVNAGLGRGVRALVWRVCYAQAVQRLRGDLSLGARERTAPQARMLYNFSPHLLPPPADWPADRIRVTGSWVLPAAKQPPPSDALRAFVDAGEPPVVIGFGSMRGSPALCARLSEAVTEAVRRSGRRTVAVRGWGAVAVDSHARLLAVDQAPYDWLLPRAAAIVHHGGAGTVAAAARAGLPQVVVPFVADQPFWAWQLRRLRVSPAALSRNALTGARLADAIAAALSMREQAARLGAAMAGEDGVRTAITALEEWRLLG